MKILTLLSASLATLVVSVAIAAAPAVSWKVESLERGEKPQSTGDYFLDLTARRLITRLHGSGDIFVGGSGTADSSGYDMLVTRYAPDGTLRRRLALEASPGSTDLLLDLQVDAAGNAFLFGYTKGNLGNGYVLAKLDANGVEQWRASLPAVSQGNDDFAEGRLAQDSTGALYVAFVSQLNAREDLVMARFDAAGREMWRRYSPRASDSTFSLNALVVDPHGGAYVGGSSTRDGIAWNLEIVKLAADGGARLLAADLPAGANVGIVGAMAVDGEGNLLVAGAASATSFTVPFLSKYGIDGARQWSVQLDRSANIRGEPVGLAVDPRGQAYVSVAWRTVFLEDSFLTVKLDASGRVLWRATEEAEDRHEYLSPKAITLDAAGNAYVTGLANGRFLTVAYAARDGTALWRSNLGVSSSATLAIAQDGGVLIGGNTYDAARRVNVTTLVKLAASPAVSVAFTHNRSWYENNFFVTTMVRGVQPGAKVDMYIDGQPLLFCRGMGVRPLADEPGAGLADCEFEFPLDHGAPRRQDFEARYVSADGIEIARGAGSFTVVPGTEPLGAMYWTGTAGNGWGVSIVQRGATQMVVVYAYDDSGAPTWYVMPDARAEGPPWVAYSGSVYRTASAPFNDYDAGRFHAIPVGSARLVFDSPDSAALDAVIDGIAMSHRLVRFGAPAATDRDGIGTGLPVRDMWWGGEAEDGWGIAILPDGIDVLVVWFTYGADGKPTFFTVTSGAWKGATYQGALHSFKSSPWLGRTYDPSSLKAIPEGSLALRFEDLDNATMSYTLRGVTQQKRIRRFAF